MKAAGEAAWTNATHLVVAEPGHPRMGSFLRGADLGWAKPADADEKWEDVYVVRLADGTLAPHTVAAEAQLYVEDAVAAPGLDGAPGALAVRSALWLLREEARRKTLDEYAALCGVPADKIAELARRFTSHGKRAVADAHGGTMSGAGLHRLCHRHAEHAGRQPERGGRAGAGRRSVPALRRGSALHRRLRQPRHAQGVGLSRNRFPYEKSSEFKRKKAAGQPAIRPPRPGIRPPADSARKCWPRRWRATRTAPRSGSTT